MKVTQYVAAVHTVFFSFFPLTSYGHCVVCQFHVSTGCLCVELLVSSSRVLPAGPGDQMGQRLHSWGLTGAPSAPVAESLMGSNPQTPEF